jgi:hypothetical protein
MHVVIFFYPTGCMPWIDCSTALISNVHADAVCHSLTGASEGGFLQFVKCLFDVLSIDFQIFDYQRCRIFA